MSTASLSEADAARVLRVDRMLISHNLAAGRYEGATVKGRGPGRRVLIPRQSLEKVHGRLISDSEIASARRKVGRPRVAKYTREELDAEIVKAVRANEARWLERSQKRETWWQQRLRQAVANATRLRDKDHAEWQRSRVLQSVFPLGPEKPSI